MKKQQKKWNSMSKIRKYLHLRTIYRGIAIEVIIEDKYSCANFIFIHEGKEYRGPQGMKDENEAAAEAFRLIDSIL